MTTGSKRWWRMVALTVVAGGVVGGWLGFARPQPAKANKNTTDDTDWTRASVPVSRGVETGRVADTPDARSSSAGPVVQVSGAQPILPSRENRPVVPSAPVVPASSGTLAIPVIEPVAGPRMPDAGLIGDASALPSVPPVPVVSVPTELPPLPPSMTGGNVPVNAQIAPGSDGIPPLKFPSSAIEPPKPQPVQPPAPVPLPRTPELKPVDAAGPVPKLPVPPAVPDLPIAPMSPTGSGLTIPPVPLPGGTVEPPKAPPLPVGTAEPPKAQPLSLPGGAIEPLKAQPLSQPTPVAPPVSLDPKPAVPPMGTGAPVIPQPAGIAPPLPPIKSADPVQPMLPTKPDSDLKPSNTPNTLNPTVSPVVPTAPSATDRDVPGTQVDRPKAPDAILGPSEKFVFPIPAKPTTPEPVVPTPRDDTMYKLTTTAAFAVLGGALIAAEKAAALPAIPSSALVPAPGMLVKDDKADLDQLKTDLRAANKKIDDLTKEVKRLTDLLNGKRDSDGIPQNPKELGAVEDIKELKNKISALTSELNALKTQTSLKPTLNPEVKPKGVVKVVNEYAREISMVINDRSHRIAAGKVVEVEVPAGDFTYQLLESGAASKRSVIKDKETVTLRIK